MKIPPFFHEISFLFPNKQSRLFQLIEHFIPSILHCIKKNVRSVSDPFEQFREPVPLITIRIIRARIILLKHQDSFNSCNSCSKK